MMRLYIQLLGEFDYHEKEALWKKHLDALKFAYQLAEISFPERDLCIWRQYHNNDIFLFSELVYQERTNHSQTQDELAAAIKKDNKTISRIERNANSPKRETAKKLLDALDVPHNLFGSDIYADTYSVLETADQISYCITNGDAITGSHLLQKIKAEISIDIPVNHQYIESTELQLTNMISPMNPSEMIKRLIACFEITHPFNVFSFPNLTLSEQEVIIATQIANCERELHNSSKAVLILESMLAGFDSSKIPEYLHSASLKIILGRLKDFCETSGLFEDAKKYCMRDLILQLKCEHGLALPTIILQWFYIMEREKQPAEAYKIGYQQAYQLFLLMKKNTYLNTIKTHYFGIFGSEIQ